ncbi:hypothetical protein RhiirA4_487377 [Rhizophagus irregularis]|uniref:Uncharacterized protein n=1 Tax=Rhizophagus irregularis TaxID=588596 RepID=A0A2I1HSJ3_9GLOM|nr:hypothetical protein RhiirA4_487377 [Rhizophagus irregularis]
MSEKNEWLNWIVEAISKKHIDHKHFKNIEICTDAEEFTVLNENKSLRISLKSNLKLLLQITRYN